MLTESLLAASSAPVKLTSSQATALKDAGIFQYSLQSPIGLQQTFKKSRATANCLTSNATHIFAAQLDKATVHVYSRESGSLEASVTFPQRISSLCLACSGSCLVLGMQNGALLAWEIYTGRQITTSRAHLHAVTALACDRSGNFILSGSEDFAIHVWTISDLLSLPSAALFDQGLPKTPRHSLSGHRAAIRSIVTGHGHISLDIAASASEDKTVIIWDHRRGLSLRTILLSAVPHCLALDHVDRGLYAGLENGDVQVVDFAAMQDLGSVGHPTMTSTPFQPPPSDSMRASVTSAGGLGSTQAICLSYDGTTIFTGHITGKIASWEIARRSMNRIVAEHPEAPITNLRVLPPTGFLYDRLSGIRQMMVVKPRPHEAFSGDRGGILTGSYHISAQLRPRSSFESGNETLGPQVFNRSLDPMTFVDEFVGESAMQIVPDPKDLSHTPTTMNGSSDFISLAGSNQGDAKDELDHLREQVSHLRKMQATSNRHIEQLVKQLDRAEPVTLS